MLCVCVQTVFPVNNFPVIAPKQTLMWVLISVSRLVRPLRAERLTGQFRAQKLECVLQEGMSIANPGGPFRPGQMCGRRTAGPRPARSLLLCTWANGSDCLAQVTPTEPRRIRGSGLSLGGLAGTGLELWFSASCQGKQFR